MFISTMSGFKRKEFWSSKEINIELGAPYRLNCYMTGNRFEAILASLTLTKEDPPPYKDRFWIVREMIREWDGHIMERSFILSWASCLDESMSIWYNRYTCPGWIFCPWKPHPFGNEYHSICCAKSGIMYALEIVEGKYRPRDIPQDPNNTTCGKTGALLLRLTKLLYSTGKVVILDSWFCVLHAIIELLKEIR